VGPTTGTARYKQEGTRACPPSGRRCL